MLRAHLLRQNDPSQSPFLSPKAQSGNSWPHRRPTAWTCMGQLKGAASTEQQASARLSGQRSRTAAAAQIQSRWSRGDTGGQGGRVHHDRRSWYRRDVHVWSLDLSQAVSGGNRPESTGWKQGHGIEAFRRGENAVNIFQEAFAPSEFAWDDFSKASPDLICFARGCGSRMRSGWRRKQRMCLDQ